MTYKEEEETAAAIKRDLIEFGKHVLETSEVHPIFLRSHIRMRMNRHWKILIDKAGIRLDDVDEFPEIFEEARTAALMEMLGNASS